MPSSWPVRLRALLSIVGVVLIFLSLPLTWISVTHTAQLGPHSFLVTENRTQTTWDMLSGIFLQKEAGVLGPTILGVAFLTVLSLFVLGIIALLKRPSRRLSAGGVAVSASCLGLSLLVNCTLLRPSISFGAGTTTVIFGPGFWLPQVGLLLAATGMIMLHRRIVTELRQERETAGAPTPTTV